MWAHRQRVKFAAPPLQTGVERMTVERQRLHNDRHTPDTNASAIELREAQVRNMCAGMTKPLKVQMAPWPEPSEKTLRTWMDRHPSFKTYSSHYMASQRRLLFMVDVHPAKRFEAFEKICFERHLAPTTAESYWTTWLGIQKALGIQPIEADTRITRIMKARAAVYPVQFPNPASLSDMELLVTTFRDAHPSFASIAMATFLLGQRISDMIQLAVFDLRPTKEFLMITIRRGKTMGISTPYTLWLRRNEYPTESLIDCANLAQKENRLYLFSRSNSDDERSKILQFIREMLTSINDQLELRSIRRGGLHRMAQLGHKLDTILEFSRHADVKMLMRYLNWGEHAEDRQHEMISVVDKTTSELNLTEHVSTISRSQTMKL